MAEPDPPRPRIPDIRDPQFTDEVLRNVDPREIEPTLSNGYNRPRNLVTNIMGLFRTPQPVVPTTQEFVDRVRSRYQVTPTEADLLARNYDAAQGAPNVTQRIAQTLVQTRTQLPEAERQAEQQRLEQQRVATERQAEQQRLATERETRERTERETRERTEREARERTERETRERTERETRERTEREAREHEIATRAAAARTPQVTQLSPEDTPEARAQREATLRAQQVPAPIAVTETEAAIAERERRVALARSTQAPAAPEQPPAAVVQREPVTTRAVAARTEAQPLPQQQPEPQLQPPLQPQLQPQAQVYQPPIEQQPQRQASVFDQFAENFASSVGMNPADARTQKLFGHVHMTALRREDGMRLPQQVREAFYKFLERSGHLQAPQNGYPADFRFDEHVHRAAESWRQTVQAEQNSLLSHDPRAAAHDGVAGKVTLSQLMERRNIPPTA